MFSSSISPSKMKVFLQAEPICCMSGSVFSTSEALYGSRWAESNFLRKEGRIAVEFYQQGIEEYVRTKVEAWRKVGRRIGFGRGRAGGISKLNARCGVCASRSCYHLVTRGTTAKGKVAHGNTCQ
jgi:hypothetical protein